MKAKEYETLVQAGVVTSVVLMKRGDGWEVWCYGKRLPESTKNPIETARGTRRTWSSLDTAYSFVRGGGGRVKVSLDEISGGGEIVAPEASDVASDDIAPGG